MLLLIFFNQSFRIITYFLCHCSTVLVVNSFLCVFNKKVSDIIRFEQMENLCAEKHGWLLIAYLELRKLIRMRFLFTNMLIVSHYFVGIMVHVNSSCNPYVAQIKVINSELSNVKRWQDFYFLFNHRFYQLQQQFERDGLYSPEGCRKGRPMLKPNTLKAESWFNGWWQLCLMKYNEPKLSAKCLHNVRIRFHRPQQPTQKTNWWFICRLEARHYFFSSSHSFLSKYVRYYHNLAVILLNA